jgi:flagellar biosynthesis anti-sigma factor FlgM
MKVTGQQPPRTADRTADRTTGKTREAEVKSEAKAERAQEAAKEGTQAAGNRTSLTMNRIREEIRRTPDIRADRVDAVRERIRTGEYKVDADRLAKAILNESLRDDLEKP